MMGGSSGSLAMSNPSTLFRDLTQGVSTHLASLRSGTPEVMKSFGELGRAATANGILDRKTKELIALALGVAARCESCIGFHMQTLVKLGVTRPEAAARARGTRRAHDRAPEAPRPDLARRRLSRGPVPPGPQSPRRMSRGATRSSCVSLR